MDNYSFQSQNFDPIAYLNQRFPTEASLSGLDDQIQSLNKQLQQVNNDLIKQIHQHAMMNVHVSEQIQRARQLSKEVIKQIGIIKQKATKSQQIVYEMCKDLKSLDIAKKNLTFSIDALKKFIMMVDALQKLRDCCQKRQYKQVANLISAFNQLSNYFKKYQNIPQIQDLYKEKNAIIVELNSQIIEDFQAFQKSNTLLKAQDLSYACQVIEILGDKYHRKFIETICKIILDPYQQLYSQAQNALLQNTQRRYGWIKRKIDDFDTKFSNAFPQYWGIHCYIYYEFCSLTRISLTNILQKNSGANVAILMKSLQVTLKFEQKITNEMKKKYDKIIQANQKDKKEFRIVSLPKFKDSISNSFQPHLKPYIKSQQDAMYQSLLKNLEEDNLTQIKVYNSSLILFHSIKSVIKRANVYSRGNLMIQIIKVIKKVFKFYCDKCLQKIKKSQDFQTTICWIINTGEHCKNIISGLEEMIEGALQPNFTQNINFSDEQELFSNLISKAIQYFINHLEQRFEVIFSQISKIPWQKVEQMVDVSSYVKEAKGLLSAHFIKIKDEMNGSYLSFYLNKLVVLINNKFISNVYKCKKLPPIAFHTLHLDIIELKQILLNVVKMDIETFGNQKTLENYKSFVNKTFFKSENIIKLMNLNLESITQKFQTFMQGGTLADLDKILLVKGAKRSEVPNLVKMLQSRKQ